MDIFDLFKNFKIKKALTEEDNTINYEELDILSSKKASFLEDKNLKRGDILTITGDYSINSIVTFLGAIKTGLTIVPLGLSIEIHSQKALDLGNHYNYNSDKDEITFIPNTKENAYLASLSNKKDSYIVIYTSGSTGKPKGIVHKTSTFYKNGNTLKNRNLSVLLFLLFDHIGGINTLLTSLTSGMHIVICKKRTPDNIAEVVNKNKIHILPVTPTFLNLLYTSSASTLKKLSSLKLISYGAEPMLESVLINLKTKLPHIKFQQTFGTTEIGILRIQSKSSYSDLIKLNNGDYEHKIINNQLYVKSKKQAIGTINGGSTANDWISTGDYVEVHENGFLKIIGNRNVIINVGGQKVAALEIENILIRSGFVIDCLVYGEKNSFFGQIVACQIILKTGLVPFVAKAEIRKYCIKNLENFKVPVRFSFVKSIEKSNSLKKMRPIS